MKKMITGFAFVMLIANSLAGDLTRWVTAMTEARYQNQNTRRYFLQAQEYAIGSPVVVGDEAATNAWFEKNFADGYQYALNTNVKIRVYSDTLKNLCGDQGAAITPTERDKIITKAQQDPQVQIAFVRDIAKQFADWNIEQDTDNQP